MPSFSQTKRPHLADPDAWDGEARRFFLSIRRWGGGGWKTTLPLFFEAAHCVLPLVPDQGVFATRSLCVRFLAHAENHHHHHPASTFRMAASTETAHCR